MKEGGGWSRRWEEGREKTGEKQGTVNRIKRRGAREGEGGGGVKEGRKKQKERTTKRNDRKGGADKQDG
jgi:hypothetical protein